jgi:bacterioferritin
MEDANPFCMNNDVITREQMVELLNEDLAREYQAVHAGEELAHAIAIAKQIDYLNGTPVSVPKGVKMSDDAADMLRFDLENERDTIKNYRDRIRQADAMGEFALGETLRKIIAQEQEHLQDLADALGIDTPRID